MSATKQQQSSLDSNVLHEISLEDNINTNDAQHNKTKELIKLSKQVLTQKTSNQSSKTIQNSIDYIKKRLSIDQTVPQSNIDTENSFRKNMSAAFIEENESNYSSVSTGPSFTQRSIPNQSRRQSKIVVATDETSESKGEHAFIEFLGMFKQIYLNTRGQIPVKAQHIQDENEQRNIFSSCLQCLRPRALPKQLENEVDLLLFIYNAKQPQETSSCCHMNQQKALFDLMRIRAASILKELAFTEDNKPTNSTKIIDKKLTKNNLNVLSHLQIIAFADIHTELLSFLVEYHRQAPLHKAEQKMPLSAVANTFSREIILLLNQRKLYFGIVQQQSAINFVNNLFFALLFCYVQECARNNNNFGIAFSENLISLLIKQQNHHPMSIIDYFTKRLQSFLIDKNFLKYI